MSVEVLFTLVDPDAPVPSYAHPGDAGLDLTTRQACTLEPGERALLPTGIAIAIPSVTRRLCIHALDLPSSMASRSSTRRGPLTPVTEVRFR